MKWQAFPVRCLKTLYSVLSELEPLWLCWSAEAALVEVDMGLAFSLKSVIITVRSPTVTSRCWALLLSMFFNLGLVKKQTNRDKTWKLFGGYLYFNNQQSPKNQQKRLMYYLNFLWLFLFNVGSLSLLSFSDFSFLSFLGWVGGANCWFTCCATSCETGRGFLKEKNRLLAFQLYVYMMNYGKPLAEGQTAVRFTIFRDHLITVDSKERSSKCNSNATSQGAVENMKCPPPVSLNTVCLMQWAFNKVNRGFHTPRMIIIKYIYLI